MAELAKPNKDMLLRWLWLSEKQSVRPSVKIRLFRGLGGIEEVYRADKKICQLLISDRKKSSSFCSIKILKGQRKYSVFAMRKTLKS